MKQFTVRNRTDLRRDIVTGCVIALLSVPLSMGYAQVAGLPIRYGLYGSLFPILIFGLLTSSPRFVFGVDAAPAALVATLPPELGISPGSEEAAAVMPAITLLAAFWLFLFWLLRGGRFAKFVSEPALGGCVSGIAGVVILTQAPLLFGGAASSGRAPTLLAHLFRELHRFHPLSFALGAVTIAVILLGRRHTRASLSVLMMTLSVPLTLAFHLDRYGVALAAPVPSGLPRPAAVDFTPLAGHVELLLIDTLAVALVIAAETLVSTREIGRKYGDEIDNQKELLAYAVCNLAAALFGSSPVSGSVSRTNRANRRGVTSQWMSVSAFATLALFLLFGAPALSFVPVPVLTGIVVASLYTIIEFSMAARLWKADRSGFFIFMAAFAAELLGLSEGVIVGVALTFASFTMSAAAQPRYFLGRVKGHEGFFDMARTPYARPIAGTILYQFSGALFFANVEDFENDILAALRSDTHLVIVTGVSSVDMFAAERLLSLYRRLKRRNVALYLAGHAGAVNEQLIAYGAEELIHEGAVRQRLTQALSAGGLTPPYPLDAGELEADSGAALEEFTWAYGKYAAPRLEELARKLAEEILQDNILDMEKLSKEEKEAAGAYWNSENEEEFLNLLEMSMAVAVCGKREREEAFHKLSQGLLERRVQLERQMIQQGDTDAARDFIRLRLRREAEFLRRYPEAGALMEQQRIWHMDALRKEAPELAAMMEPLARDSETTQTARPL